MAAHGLDCAGFQLLKEEFHRQRIDSVFRSLGPLAEVYDHPPAQAFKLGDCPESEEIPVCQGRLGLDFDGDGSDCLMRR